ncbi:MAG: rfaQ 6 [Bacteroidota bacterium]|nr:rfaQ 6 [Bacteroidota bacterium]
MTNNENKRALIFFSAGVGDTILLVPLVNELIKNGYHVTGLFTSPFNCESIFTHTQLFHKIVVKTSKLELLLYSVTHINRYDRVFLNHFAFSYTHAKLARLMGKAVYSNHLGILQHGAKMHFVEPKDSTHDALQNLFLYESRKTMADLDFNLSYKPTNKNKFNLPQQYICVQISSANSKAPYKNWPLDNWIQTFNFINTRFPQTSLVILGDYTEKDLSDLLVSHKLNNVVLLIGETTLTEATEVIYHSVFYLGLDSGLMHIAVALNKPTFTIWGATDKKLYGYNWMGQAHLTLSLDVWCAPCSAWINPNRKRVSDPLMCPDFQCIKNISSEQVNSSLEKFMNANSILFSSENAQ